MEDSYGELPVRRIAAWQLVAYNLARFRKTAGLTGSELGEMLGWTKGTVSAHERAWDGKKREFGAGTMLAIATALRMPVAGLLLPPEDDGDGVRYVVDVPDGRQIDMPALLGFLMPNAVDEYTAVANYYHDRVDALIAAHLPDRRLGYDAGALRTEDEVADARESIRERREVMRKALAYLGEMDAELAGRGAQIRGGRS